MRWPIAPPWPVCALLLARAFGRRSPWTRSASRRRQLERATRLTLDSLDARTLHDLGIDRGEIPFLAAQVADGRIARVAERGEGWYLP